MASTCRKASAPASRMACAVVLWTLLSAAMGGCISPHLGPSPPDASLRTEYPETIWCFRLAGDVPPGGACVQPLCEEFDLLTIRTAEQWRDFRRRLELRRVGADLDFHHGMLVGIAARLGEPIRGEWPIKLLYLRRKGGLGSLAAEVRPGLYRPTASPPYCQLAYFSDVKQVAIVQVNNRLFYLE
jgi:hypothetical protein